jgi:hypothetical protein
MTQSVYERVLGSDFELLAPELRAYFSGGHGVGMGTGIFEIAGCRLAILRPVLAYLARQRILFPEFARDVPFDIVNTPTATGELDALRTFHLPAHDRPLEDTMRVIDGQLHDFMGNKRGFEVRMALAISNGFLTMRSDRQWVRILGARVRIPQLATVTVSESWLDGHQHVDVRLSTPVIGQWFRYAGSFTYSYPGA